MLKTLHAHHHCDWRPDRAPALTAAPGEPIALSALDASHGHFSRDSDARRVLSLDPSRVNPVTGPIAVDGAAPGDALMVTIEDLSTDDWGWTANIPGFGLLSDDFPEPVFKTWSLDRARGIAALDGGRAWAPARPFMGTLGVSPGAPGVHPIIPPWRTGGNLDCRDLVAGACIVLPVEVSGALLSMGDGHIAQGDGEVCGTAIETATQLTVRLDLQPGKAPRAPVIEAPAAAMREPEPRLTTTGVGPDYLAAARDAVRQMIDELAARRGLSAEDAYLLCSVCGEMRAAQLVDAPNWTAAFSFPLSRLD
ncbi:MAG: acetamidase/formamidase family protein [Oceanicaulis sp.]